MEYLSACILLSNTALVFAFIPSPFKSCFMQAETILRSDVLDIIFENRNKQYGAYELRKSYNKRLISSIAIIAILVFLWLALSFFRRVPGNHFAATREWKIDTVTLTTLQPPKSAEPVIKTIEKVATVKNPPPIIVPDNLATDTMPTVDALQNKVIGLKNIDAPLPGDGPQPVTGDSAAANNIVAGPAPDPAPEPLVRETAEVMPAYPGGIEALRRFLGRNLQVPEEAVAPGSRVKVPIRFVVNKNGELSDVEFPAGADERLKNEILRVVKKMPKWVPGSQNGHAVPVYFSIPIIFEISE